MWPNPQFPAALVTFTEEILGGKLHFLCSVGGEKDILASLFALFQRKWRNKIFYILILILIHSDFFTYRVAETHIPNKFYIKIDILTCRILLPRFGPIFLKEVLNSSAIATLLTLHFSMGVLL